MTQVTRRRFLESTTTLAAAGSVGYLTSTSPVRAAGPNDRPQIAVIGCGGQGTGDGRRAQDHADIVAVCDVDTSHSAYAKAGYTRRMAAKGKQAMIDVYDDYRAIIDRDDIDAIICGTVDHWHVKISAEAMKS
ncbi:MAG: Gfo/Idh/MocA family oxidoreductase [Rubripirellula sp.]|nr:Gfo/Idh/MocA family oxidoreductase [Rubripirellula sp.]